MGDTAVFAALGCETAVLFREGIWSQKDSVV